MTGGRPVWWTIADIAQALGVKRATVDIWRWRGDLPREDGYLGATPFWNPMSIERWAKATGRWPGEDA